VHMFCVVRVVSAIFLCCESGKCKCFVFGEWCVHMFCVVRVVRAYVLCCESGACTCFVL
jgi:hypothetical protein